MEIKPFTAVLPSTTGLTKLENNDSNWNAADQRVQPGAGYYWYELTHNGIHQWRLIASQPEQLSITTMLPGGINTVLYSKQPVIEMLIDDWVGHFPKTVEFTDPQQVTHRLWQITEDAVNDDITEAMAATTPRKTWLTTTTTPLVMLVADSEWTKFKTQPQVPEHLIQILSE